MSQLYLTEEHTSNDEKIQQLIRVVDATLAEVSPGGLYSGLTALKFTKLISELDGFRSFVSNDFSNYITEQLQAANQKTNVKGEVKRVLRYPLIGYTPWNTFQVNGCVLNSIHNEISLLPFSIEIGESKIVATCTSNIPMFTEVVYSQLSYELQHVVETEERSSFTIVDYNTLSKLEMADVLDFVMRFNSEFFVVAGDIKHKIMNDCSVFSECYAVEVSSQYVDTFLEKFNLRFDTNSQPEEHITFAVKHRTLW